MNKMNKKLHYSSSPNSNFKGTIIAVAIFVVVAFGFAMGVSA